MMRQLLIMALILASLVFWERRLAKNEAQARRTSVRIQRLVSPEPFKRNPLAALLLETPQGETFFYAQRQGTWRCLSAHGAVASTSQIQSLLQKLFTARGTVQGRIADYGTNLRDFGLGASQRFRLSLCGPAAQATGGDVIFALDIGQRVSAGGGSFVRPGDDTEIWSVDMDFRQELERPPNSRLPPLLDPHLVPMTWPGWKTGLRAVLIERPGKLPVRMELQDKQITEEQQRAGTPPWDWIIRVGNEEKKADPRQAYFYTTYLLQAPFLEVLPPDKRTEFGLDSPATQITLESEGAAPLRLILGGISSNQERSVLNTFSQTAVLVAPEVASNLLPETATLMDGQQGNPWKSR